MIVVFRVEFNIFGLVLNFRIFKECLHYFLSDCHFAFRRARSASDLNYIGKQIFRAILARGEKAVAVHVDYKSAFDSLSHIFIFKSLKTAGASCKTLQLYKAIYTKAQVVAKAGTALSEPFDIDRGALEGDVNSPIIFSIGLEAVFREAEELNKSFGLSGGIKLFDVSYSKIVFADDVTLLGDT